MEFYSGLRVQDFRPGGLRLGEILILARYMDRRLKEDKAALSKA